MAAFAWLMVTINYVLRSRLGRPAKVTLLEYQRGIRYRRGLARDEVGPGQHWSWTGFEKTIFLDTRPIALSYQNQVVTLSDGFTAIYGFSASVEVRSVRKALYSSQAYSQMPAFVLLSCMRTVLSESDSKRVRISQQNISNEITERARTRLDAAGFVLASFRMGQLGIAASN